MKPLSSLLLPYMKVKEYEDPYGNKEVKVRVWKPSWFLPLPDAYFDMAMKDYVRLFGPGTGNRVRWIPGNPDYGSWDAKTMVRLDPKKMIIDVYICALLVRPFSMQACKHYETFVSLSRQERLSWKWDSRLYDKENNYEAK